MKKKNLPLILFLFFTSWPVFAQIDRNQETLFCNHKIVLDSEGKLLPWYFPHENAYDHFLHLRWNFIKSNAPDSPCPVPRSNYPQYYFYCAFFDKNGKLEPDLWMNDIGEKIPNWFENARLYYAYTGDYTAVNLVKHMMDYYLEHGTSASDFAWPGFPYTTTNAGDTLFRGFTSASRFSLHEIQVDHAGEMGLTYYRMYLLSGDDKYLKAAIQVANVLAKYVRNGDENKSVWPYTIKMDTGEITSEYGANWTGCYMLFDNLISAKTGNVAAFKVAKELVKNFLLNYPMKTGYWTDGHSDTKINSNTYKSNLSASNMTLCMFDYPEINPDRNKAIPMLIKFTEYNFVFCCAPLNPGKFGIKGINVKEFSDIPTEPAIFYGALIVGEQDSFIFKMDYQTARYAAVCARWYAMSGDTTFKEKAFRSLNFVTYCNDSTGKAFESPFSKGINSWWSDCYGECPRMFYHAFAGVPEFAPPRENHILYSEGILKDIRYEKQKVEYILTKANDTEYLRLSFNPDIITLSGKRLPLLVKNAKEGYTIRNLKNGDFAITVTHKNTGRVMIKKSMGKI
ncbi:MAG: hypothetical protein U0W24_17895 [Bacteroidales bacterium]